MNWASDKDDIYGVLTPIVNGKRVFMNVATKEQFPMEAKKEELDKISIGKHVFSKKGFEKAIAIINIARPKRGWLIIDEIGPLELLGQGFSKVLNEVIAEANEQLHLLIVVRKELVEKIKEQFGLEEAEVTEKW
jgi:nucleoside-triphosphatase THEP1